MAETFVTGFIKLDEFSSLYESIRCPLWDTVTGHYIKKAISTGLIADIYTKWMHAKCLLLYRICPW